MHKSFVLGRTFSDGSNQAKVVILKKCGAFNKLRPLNCTTYYIWY